LSWVTPFSGSYASEFRNPSTASAALPACRSLTPSPSHRWESADSREWYTRESTPVRANAGSKRDNDSRSTRSRVELRRPWWRAQFSHSASPRASQCPQRGQYCPCSSLTLFVNWLIDQFKDSAINQPDAGRQHRWQREFGHRQKKPERDLRGYGWSIIR
jgi:hypothetical protein